MYFTIPDSHHWRSKKPSLFVFAERPEIVSVGVSFHVVDEILQRFDGHRAQTDGHDGSNAPKESLHLGKGFSPTFAARDQTLPMVTQSNEGHGDLGDPALPG